MRERSFSTAIRPIECPDYTLPNNISFRAKAVTTLAGATKNLATNVHQNSLLIPPQNETENGPRLFDEQGSYVPKPTPPRTAASRTGLTVNLYKICSTQLF